MSTEFERRLFLRLATGLFVGASLTHALPVGAQELPQPDLRGLFSEGKQYTQEIIQRARKFMALEPPQRGRRNLRTTLEEEMFDFLEKRQANTSDVISGLKAAGTIDGRAWGLQLLWNHRQSGNLIKYDILPLDQARIKWALDQGIDPRTLAIYRDCLFPALELLKAAPDLFFEAMSERERSSIVYKDVIPNPGAMAMLNFTETGYTNSNEDPMSRYWADSFIGGAAAWNELNLNQDYFPSGHTDLIWIAQRLQDSTGLPYLDYVRTIPGSERGDFIANSSGGAIGPQFMPINARLFMDWYDRANARLGNKYPAANPFVPYISEIMTELYLAAEWFGRHGSINGVTEFVRPGYNAYASDAYKISVFRKWNPTDQARWALDAGYSYYASFGRI